MDSDNSAIENARRGYDTPGHRGYYFVSQMMTLPYVAAYVGLDPILGSKRQIRGCFFEGFGVMYLFFSERDEPERISALRLNSYGTWTPDRLSVVIHGLLTEQLGFVESEDLCPFSEYLSSHPEEPVDRLIDRFYAIDTSAPSDLLAKNAPFAWPTSYWAHGSLKISSSVLMVSSGYVGLERWKGRLEQHEEWSNGDPQVSESLDDQREASPQLLGFVALSGQTVRYYRREGPLTVAYQYDVDDADAVRFTAGDLCDFLGSHPEESVQMRKAIKDLPANEAAHITFANGVRLLLRPDGPARLDVGSPGSQDGGFFYPGDGFASLVIRI
ncbi:MAG: hypothetical protein ACP5HZ_12545 [Ferrimicrobium sp.]